MLNSLQNLLAEATTKLLNSSETALLDAEVLLCHCLNKNRSFLRAWPEKIIDDELCLNFRNLILLRQEGTPVAYLTGKREFWSRTFLVSSEVLIPRPDSELLIELSLKLIPANQTSKIIDLGTGSGILAITLAKEISNSDILATDLSPTALDVAKQNAIEHNTQNVRFIHSNWFANVTETEFDLVISNPPYIVEGDKHLQNGDLRFEPAHALVSGGDGLKDIRLIAAQSRAHLKNHGRILVEHGYNQQAGVQRIFTDLNYQEITTHIDLSGQPRVTSALWNQQ